MSSAPKEAAAPSYRFFLTLGLTLLLFICLGLGLIFGWSSYADVEHLRHIRYHDSTFRYLAIELQPAGYALSKALLVALLASLGMGALWQFRTVGGLYRELAALRAEWQAAPPLLAPWRALEPGERRTALGLLGALLLVRGYYLVRFPLYGDELVTYLSFVREGAVAATSFYPIPNNHILYSVVCWLFSLLSENFHWVMRGPTFLISAGGTVLVGLLLLTRLPFRVVALGLGLFGFFPYALFQAVVGRGYFLLAVCSQLAFLAGLALLRGTSRPRLAWTGLVVASVVGFYAIPTFLLVFVGLVAGLAGAFRRQPRQLIRLGAAGLLTGLATLLLYAPVLLVSGPAALLGNAFVAPGAGRMPNLNVFTYPVLTEGQLLGLGPVSLPLLLALSLLAILTSHHWRATATGLDRRLTWLILSVIWLPYLVLAGRSVYPPARVLSFRAFFVFLLGALLFEALLRGRPWRAGWQHPALTVALPVLLWAAVVLVPFQRRATLEADRNARVAQVYEWLRQRQAHAILTTHPHSQLYLLFFSQTNRWPLTIDATRQPGTHYDYQLLDKEAEETMSIPAPIVFENADVRIHQLPRP
jgi:hypothetical protein